jgi:hypothetical protein
MEHEGGFMHTVRFKHWQDGDAWLGYLVDYPTIGLKARVWMTSRIISPICIAT